MPMEFTIFNTAGGFAPTFGIIGTVMGLISVLKELDNPAKLAGSIASAFLATLWGLLSSNMIFLPLGGKLAHKDAEEVAFKTMLLEGILSLQAGENPRIVREKLQAFLPPSAVAKAAARHRKERKGKSMSYGGGGDRWLVSYSDFITLLMVLFVVLYSMGQVDVEKYKMLAENLRSAFAGGGR